MRTILTAAVCLVVGACATFGTAPAGTFGNYDVVSVNGESLPHALMTEGSYYLRGDGTSLSTIQDPSTLAPTVSSGTFSLGKMTDGCIPFIGKTDQGQDGEMTGSICGGVFMAEGVEYSMVLHRRN